MTLRLTKKGEKLLAVIKIITKSLETYHYDVVFKELLKYENISFKLHNAYPFEISYIIDGNKVDIENEAPYYERNQIRALLHEAFITQNEEADTSGISPRQQNILKDLPIQIFEDDKVLNNLNKQHKSKQPQLWVLLPPKPEKKKWRELS